MSQPLHPHAELIERLGGARKVSELLKIRSRNTIHYWERRGIPAAKFADIVRLADELGVEGISFERLYAEKSDPLHGLDVHATEAA
jgi:hypothetical protein